MADNLYQQLAEAQTRNSTPYGVANLLDQIGNAGQGVLKGITEGQKYQLLKAQTQAAQLENQKSAYGNQTYDKVFNIPQVTDLQSQLRSQAGVPFGPATEAQQPMADKAVAQAPAQRQTLETNAGIPQGMGNIPINQAKEMALTQSALAGIPGKNLKIKIGLLNPEALAKAKANGFSEMDEVPKAYFDSINSANKSSDNTPEAAAAKAKAVRLAQNAADKESGKLSYADVKLPGLIVTELPSNQSPTTASGAAAQVQLAVRQGKALIAKPGSPQEIALASSDLARAVQRSTPQLETLQGSSFANNIYTQISQLTQKITADPSSADVPKLRRQIYNILDDLEKSSRPIIERQLSTIESLYGDKLPAKDQWETVKNKQLGGDFPDIPFQETGLPAKQINTGSKSIVDQALMGNKISAQAKAIIKNKRANGVSDDDISKLLQGK